MFRYLPEQASSIAPRVDWLNNWITDISVFFTIAICGSMLYFVIRYRKRGGVDHETPRIEGGNFLEVLWTVVPTVISIAVAYYGVVIFKEMRQSPEDALVINVRASKWQWDFEYENGKRTTGEYTIPVNKPVRFVLTSGEAEVLHSFFVPAMRVKSDVIPGKYTSVAFTPVKVGTYPTFCTEYCGELHSSMLATLNVVPQAEYDRWVNDRSDELAKLSMNLPDLGKKLYSERGCNGCHTIDGGSGIGPTFLNFADRDREFADGTKGERSDEYLRNYMRESILNPDAKIVKGYAPQMSPYEGQLTDRELSALIEFILSVDDELLKEALAEEPTSEEPEMDFSQLTPVEHGKWVYENKLCFSCHSIDGSKRVGPTFLGLYGRSGQLTDGSQYVADDEYLKRSIYEPAVQVVDGYPASMPAFKEGPNALSEEEVAHLIEFMKSLN